MSRTSKASWTKVRDEARRLALQAGQHHCPSCGVWLDYEYSRRPNSAEVDHILAYARGGTDTIENTQVLCRWCNQRKGAGKRPKIEAKRINAGTKITW